MTKKMTATKLKMAAIGNNVIEAGKEIYRDLDKDKQLNKEEKDHISKANIH